MSKSVTCNGQVIDLNNLSSIIIDLDTVLRSAVKVCRFNGHTKYHYSNLQHMYLVSCIAKEPELKLPALLHDVHEVICGDILTYVAEFLGKEKLDQLKLDLDTLVANQLGCPSLMDQNIRDRVKYYDKQMTAIEAFALIPNAGAVWSLPEISTVYVKKEANRVVMKKFSSRYHHLKKQQAKVA